MPKGNFHSWGKGKSHNFALMICHRSFRILKKGSLVATLFFGSLSVSEIHALAIESGKVIQLQNPVGGGNPKQKKADLVKPLPSKPTGTSLGKPSPAKPSPYRNSVRNVEQPPQRMRTAIDSSKMPMVHVTADPMYVIRYYPSAGNVQVIGSREIQMMPVRSTSELLQYALGVDMRTRGPQGVQSDIQIQGSTFDQVLVLVNGIKMSDPQTGHHQLNLSINPEMIDRIEIVKGAAAHLYGVNALAGVVNIITKTPVKNSTTITVQRGFGDQINQQQIPKPSTLPKDDYYHSQSYRLLQQWNSLTGITAWLNVDVDFGNGYRPNTGFQAIRSNFLVESRSKYVQRQGKWMRVFDPNRLADLANSYRSDEVVLHQRVMGGFIRNQFGANGFYAAPRDSNAYEYVNTQWGGWVAQVNASRLGSLTLSLNARTNQDRFVFNQFNPSYYQNFHNSSVVNPEALYSLSLSRILKLGLGAEYRREAISSTNLGERNREYWGTRMELILNPLKPQYYASENPEGKRDLQITFGLYSLKNSVLGSQLYPGGNVVYRYKNHKVFGRVGTGQRLPTFTDLYYKDPVNASNAKLLPERSTFYDAGYQVKVFGIWMQANAFRRYNFQMIDRIKDSLTAPWMQINLQSLYVQGWDITGRYDLRLKKLFPALQKSILSFMTSYAELNSHRLDTQNLPSISQFNVSLLPKQWISSVVYQNGSLQVGVYHRMVQRTGLANTIQPNYHLWDARLNWSFGLKSRGAENGISKGSVTSGSSLASVSSSGSAAGTVGPPSVAARKPFVIWLQVQNMMGVSYRDFAAIPLLPRWITIGAQVQF